MKKKIVLLLTFLFLLSPSILFAESPSQEESLPIGLTAEEMLRLDEIGMYHQVTTPPTGMIRNPAEWEPSQGVIIRWPLGISVAIIAEMSEDLMVTTIVGSSAQETSARNAYIAGGVNMVHTQFIIAPTNTYWTRDYGPWFIFSDGNSGIVDHIYNRPRPYDDLIPGVIGNAWGIPVYGMDLIHTGGNHMSDGLGMSMSSKLVYDENPTKTHAQIDSIMLAYLGNDYTVLDYVEDSGIHHIDCWAKFLNPTTILVKQVAQNHPSYARLNARAGYLAQQISAWGKPYTIVRVYCQSGAAYTNSIILGKKVLVPTFNNSYYDNLAIQTYQNAMPGYEVLGFSGSWLEDDAIHCRAMGVPDLEMLFVDHIPLQDQEGDTNGYRVPVYISAYSGAALIQDSLKIYYKVDNGNWNYIPLETSAYPDSFFAFIPPQTAGSVISYYVKAADNTGRIETHPYIGASWAHHFTDTGDALCCDVNMIPDTYPINIPPGGSFGATGIIGNPTSNSILTDVWVGVKYLGNFYQIWNFPNIPLNAGQFLSAHLNQMVPGFAPTGTYDYISYCGDQPVKCDSAIFQFAVTGSRLTDGYGEWILEGGWGQDDGTPDEYGLIGAYPNPFNASATIIYELPAAGEASLAIYNMLGQKVAELVDGFQKAGRHSIAWEASGFSSGIYFAKLTIGERAFTERMTLVK